MKGTTITFLGTGPSGRIPRPGCLRPSCRDARQPGSRSARLQSSLLLRHNSSAILFDVSEDVLLQWRHAHGVRRLDAIFLSHPHSDAIGGMPKLPALLASLGQRQVAVHAEPETIERIAREVRQPTWAKFIEFHPGSSADIGTVTVGGFRVEHTHDPKFPTLGFSVTVGGKRLVIMTDVKMVDADTLRRLAAPDLLIMDCAIYQEQFPSHVNFAEAQDIIRALAPRRTYLTQIGVTWPPYEEARTVARTAVPHLDISYDGLTVRL